MLAALLLAMSMSQPSRYLRGPNNAIILTWPQVQNSVAYAVERCYGTTCDAIQYSISAAYFCGAGAAVTDLELQTGMCGLTISADDFPYADFRRQGQWQVHACDPSPPLPTGVTCRWTPPVKELRLTCCYDGSGCPSTLFPDCP